MDNMKEIQQLPDGNGILEEETVNPIQKETDKSDFLVLEQVVDYLDFNSLKKLRSLCSQTKLLVDKNQRYLRRLGIHIEDDARLEAVTQSEINWTKFTLHMEHPFESEGKNLIPFLQRFRPHMTQLVIQFRRTATQDSVGGMLVLHNILINLGPSLEVLKIDGMFYYMERGEAKRILDEYLEGESMENLKGLRVLTLLPLPPFGNGVKFVRKFYQKAMKICPNLAVVNIPIGFSPGSFNEDDGAESANSSLLQFVKSMKGRTLNPSPQINFLAGEFAYMAAFGVSYPFPLTPFDLMELVPHCKAANCKLLNVPSSAIPSPEILQRFCLRQVQDLTTALTSIVSTDQEWIDGIGQREIVIPPECELRIEVTHDRNGIRHGPTTSSIPLTTNLTSICFNCYGEAETSLEEQLRHLGRPRHSVQEIRINWTDAASYLGCDIQLSNRFPNLKILYVSLETHCTVFGFTLLMDLENLEDLTLHWMDVEDYFLTALRNSKKLTHLRLKDCVMKKVTDASFQEIFKFLNLQTFIFRPRDKNRLPEITFQEGFSALASPDQQFRNTIRRFEALVLSGTSLEEMKGLLDGFPNLKFSRLYTKVKKPGDGPRS